MEQLKTRRIRVDHADDYVLLSDIPEGEHEIRLVKITEAQVGLMDFRGAFPGAGNCWRPPPQGSGKSALSGILSPGAFTTCAG